MSGFPQTPGDVLAVIQKAERSRKYVWTAGRVVMEGGLNQFWSDADAKHKKQMLKRITGFLEVLASEDILARRPVLQGIGYGQEKAFDFILRSRMQADAPSKAAHPCFAAPATIE